MKKNRHIAIVGAGLIGSLLSIYLVKRGYKVSVYERRPDMRKGKSEAGRSINLALSNRGIKALEEAGVATNLRKVAIPMHGRMIHDNNGFLNFFPYGKEGQFINSVSRSSLNIALLDKADKNGVDFNFNQKCLDVDFEKTSLTLQINGTNSSQTLNFDMIIGADGAYSAVRGAMQQTAHYAFSQETIDHGYKELHIPAGKYDTFQMEKNALHIWPRESFMLIALPNPDSTFTCTLFLPMEGPTSFATLNNDESIASFFENHFHDAKKLIPNLIQDFKNNPTSSLITIKAFPWRIKNTFVIGDAAHAIVPFYGQGMNAGFEDCRIFNELLTKHRDNWETALDEFQALRKPDADAIAQLALDNFIEMRDLVSDPQFQLRKKIEAKLHELYPDRWIPLYSMVTFNENIRYSDAYQVGQKQTAIMTEVLKTPGVADNWQNLNFSEIVNKLA